MIQFVGPERKSKILHCIQKVDVLAYFHALMTTPGTDLRALCLLSVENIEKEFVEKVMKCLREEALKFNEEINKANAPYAGEALRMVNQFLDRIEQ